MSFLIALRLACFISTVFVYVMNGRRNWKGGYLHCLLVHPQLQLPKPQLRRPYLAPLAALWVGVPTTKLMLIYIAVTDYSQNYHSDYTAKLHRKYSLI